MAATAYPLYVSLLSHGLNTFKEFYFIPRFEGDNCLFPGPGLEFPSSQISPLTGYCHHINCSYLDLKCLFYSLLNLGLISFPGYFKSLFTLNLKGNRFFSY